MAEECYQNCYHKMALERIAGQSAKLVFGEKPVVRKGAQIHALQCKLQWALHLGAA